MERLSEGAKSKEQREGSGRATCMRQANSRDYTMKAEKAEQRQAEKSRDRTSENMGAESRERRGESRGQRAGTAGIGEEGGREKSKEEKGAGRERRSKVSELTLLANH
jgi:hypothetical protein